LYQRCTATQTLKKKQKRKFEKHCITKLTNLETPHNIADLYLNLISKVRMGIPCWTYAIVYSELPSATRNVLSITKLTMGHAVFKKERISHRKRELRYLKNCNKDLTLVHTRQKTCS